MLQMYAFLEAIVNWAEASRARRLDSEPIAEDTEPLTGGPLSSDAMPAAAQEGPAGTEVEEHKKIGGMKIMQRLGFQGPSHVIGPAGGKAGWVSWMRRFSVSHQPWALALS